MHEVCDVLYIHPIKNPNDPSVIQFSFVPMGIIGILNQLRTRDVRVIGMNYMIEQSYAPDFCLADRLRNMDYKILMTDLHWYEHSFGAMYVVEQSKKVHPDVPTVIGGYTSTIFSEEIMENFPGVDFVVTGDSDLPMEQLVDRLLGRTATPWDQIPNLLYRQDGAIRVSGKTWIQTSLDGIDFVSTDFFLHPEAFLHTGISGLRKNHTQQWLCIARGCVYNCAYCCGANKNMEALFRRCNVLKRSPEKVAEDFCRITEKGARQICPSHDFQMFGKAYYQSIFSEIRKRNVKPGMYLECFQLPTREYIDDIERTFDKRNLLLVISPISGNEALRRENGKHFTNDELYDILTYLREKGIRVQLYYTLNPVGETAAQFQDTYFQMNYLWLVYRMRRRDIIYQRVVIDPLAGLRDFENVDVTYNTFMDYYHYCQLPGDLKNTATGYTDGCELSAEYKMEKYLTLLG